MVLHRAIFSCSLLVMCCVGCGSDEGNGGQATETKNKGVVGVTLQNLTNPFFMVIAENLEQELRQHGYTIDLQSGEEDVAKQRDQFKDFIVKNVVAIVVNPRDSAAIGPAIVDANKAGIPVFTVDIRCLDPEAKVVAHVGSDNYGGGKLAGDAMVEALGETGGKVALLDYDVVESCIERERGFKEVIEAHNTSERGGKIEIVVELPCGGTPEQGFSAAQDAVQKFPDLTGLFAINDPAAIGACRAIESAGKSEQIVVVGFDGQPEGKQAIKDGRIYADPIQHPDEMGQRTATAILRYLDGQPVESEYDIPTTLYRKSDADKDPSLQ